MLVRSRLRAHLWRMSALAVLAASLIVTPPMQIASAQGKSPGTYRNPLNLQLPAGGVATSCADPSIIKGQQAGDNYWYLYCTKDPLNDQDKDANGNFIFHNIPMFKSLDLVNWTYVGDAFANVPSWGEPTSGVWAPEISYKNGIYFLYYTMTDPKPEVSGAPNCGFEPAIGVATSTSPTGPWVDAGAPVVEPRYNGAPRPFGDRECNFFWTFDPDVLHTNGQSYIYYGSYYGGIQVRPLSANGLSTDPATAVQVTIPNRYEGAEVIYRDGFYYLFVSAGNCCNGALTGYSVFAGRSTSPLGPFVDQQGISLLIGRVGGTPVLTQNGNRWVGAGHNTLFQDLDGQWWTAYHAIDRNDPVFAGTTDFTKRPVLLDAIDWVNGWPVVRGGRGPSDTPQHAPAAQSGQKTNAKTKLVKPDTLGQLLEQYSDEFNGTPLSPQWSWVRPPDPSTYNVSNGALNWQTQAADLFEGNNSASVLNQPAPNGNYVVEAKVTLNLPPEGCCFNYVQAGVAIYGNDDAYVRLMHVSIWETRQTEFAKEVFDPFRGNVHFGGTLVGAPGETTWLRIVKQTRAGEEHYTAYTSNDGVTWVRGGTWTLNLGNSARIALLSMGGSGFIANFDYVRVYSLNHGRGGYDD
jgi:arabinan endo-1,5-alpha-L-arabinosidase